MITHDYYFCQMGDVCRNMTRYNTGKKNTNTEITNLTFVCNISVLAGY